MLLILFFIGYLAVGIFGDPDLIVSGILFGGSIFVFVMYKLMTHIKDMISEGELINAKLIAAEESNRAKTDFLASVSHEMRTPMNVIIGLDTIALREPDLSPDNRHRLEKIGESAKYLLGLINNILELNNAKTHEFEIKNELFSLSDSLRQVNAIASSLCEDKGLSYEFEYSDDVDGSYLGDETVLKQVLLILLDNAVKYTDAPGTVKLSLYFTEEDSGARTVRFTVSDTGKGIDSAFLPRIFDAFACENQSMTGGIGTGLGLAVAKGYVERMGGSITAENGKDKGAVFSIMLPMTIIAEDPESQREQTEEITLEGKRILIVEDIPENAEIVADLLELEGVVSEHAENGKIGVDMFRESPIGYYDAVLMDLRMPVMDGLTATREIRNSNRADAGTIPIIALSANAFETDIKKSLDAGMNAHLAKPADADQLYATINKFISLNKADT